MREPVAFKVLLPAELAVLERDGRFDGASLDVAGGFIHMSTAGQLDRTIRKHFVGVEELCIAAVDLAVLGNRVAWEPSASGQIYPHLYGSLPLEAVIAYGPVERNSDGTVRLPITA